MKNSLNNRLRRGLACAAAVLTALAMTACSTSSSSFSMVSKPDNTIEVKSENADPDTVHAGREYHLYLQYVS
ncbi:MAG TPA: hypothetical protein DCZ61_07780, partial [Lachnospiraceae bacterium]|nr:hypothetical protein [Lachnospiraceae bacterium]